MGRALVFQPGPQVSGLAIDFVSGEPGERHAGRRGAADHCLGLAWLGGGLHLIGVPRRPAPLTVLSPRLAPGRTRGRSAHARAPTHRPGKRRSGSCPPAIRPPRRPRILPLHPSRAGALLQEARLIGDQHPIRLVQLPGRIGSQRPPSAQTHTHEPAPAARRVRTGPRSAHAPDPAQP